MHKRLLCLILAISCILPLAACKQNSHSPVREIRFLDVGQGDATLLRTADGDILIDASTNAEQEALCLHLKALGVEHLKLAIFTHSDEDHIGGADGILRQFPTEQVWISPFFEDGECTRDLLSAAEETGAELLRVTSRQTQTIGAVTLSVLSPLARMKNQDVNETGIVLKLSVGKITALMMADTGKETEELLLEHYGRVQFDCDLLKVGHHGAETSSSERFLKAVRPQYAVISCGAGNEYGHPHGEILARLDAVGSKILRTDLLGDIVITTDGAALQIENEIK